MILANLLVEACVGSEAFAPLFGGQLSAMRQRENIEGQAYKPKSLTKLKCEISLDIKRKAAQRH